MPELAGPTVAHLARLLNRAKIATGPEDLADMLWLAQQISAPVEASSGSGEIAAAAEEPLKTAPETEAEPPEPLISPTATTVADSEPEIPLALPPLPDPDQATEAEPPGLPVKAPAAPALRIRLELARALRPLRRQVPSPRRGQFDEAATIERIVDQGIWSPVLSPAPERWLEVALVVEEHKSTALWRETIAEFQTLLERQGAFRSVSLWSLRGGEEMALFSGQGASGRSRSPRELLHPAGRRLVLVLSDCTSSLWHRGSLYPWLRLWSQQAPTAIVQLLPERLWAQTGLVHGVPMWLSALEPGMPSARLAAVSQLPLWNLFQTPGPQVTLPVVSLEAAALKRWARVVAGAGESRTVGLRFTLGNGGETAPDTTTPSPLERVRLFRATASLTAQKLAGLMSAAPVSPAVVNLIRQTLLPEAEPVHVAEVYMGGLMEAQGEGGYDFIPEVRELLSDAISITDTEQVLDQVSRYISERIGVSTRSFEALLAMDLSDRTSAQAEVLPFAQVAARVLRRMGGDYAAIADSIAAPTPQTGGSEAYPLQTYTFRQATVVFAPRQQAPPLTAFEFETATVTPAAFDADAFKFNQACTFLSDLLRQRRSPKQLGSSEWQILRAAWYGLRYAQLSHGSRKHEHDLRSEAYQLWKFLSDFLEVGVTKASFRRVITQQYQRAAQPAFQVVRQRRQAQQQIETLTPQVELAMVYVPGGEFSMGSTAGYAAERPQHRVQVAAFLMGKYPVTQAQWRAVAALPEISRRLEPSTSHFSGPQRPVETVTWFDAVEFCDRLSRLTGRIYRLPTEAEWEYACRSGTKTPFHFGETIVPELANYDQPEAQTSNVGSFPANGFGLYDMHGNVCEWCLDEWHRSYDRAPTDGSAWTAPASSSNRNRVLRGGSWYYAQSYCRSAFRSGNPQDYRLYNVGFRVVGELSAPPNHGS